MFDSGLALYIRYTTKLNKKKCSYVLFKYNDGSSRILCLKKKFLGQEVEEIFSTQDSFTTSEKVIEILSDCFTFGLRLPKYKIIEIWEG